VDKILRVQLDDLSTQEADAEAVTQESLVASMLKDLSTLDGAFRDERFSKKIVGLRVFFRGSRNVVEVKLSKSRADLELQQLLTELSTGKPKILDSEGVNGPRKDKLGVIEFTHLSKVRLISLYPDNGNSPRSIVLARFLEE